MHAMHAMVQLESWDSGFIWPRSFRLSHSQKSSQVIRRWSRSCENAGIQLDPTKQILRKIVLNPPQVVKIVKTQMRKDAKSRYLPYLLHDWVYCINQNEAELCPLGRSSLPSVDSVENQQDVEHVLSRPISLVASIIMYIHMYTIVYYI